MQQEIFGPILSLVKCDTFNQAADFINERDTPLAAYCFTKGIFLPFSYGTLTITFIDKITKNRFESEIRSGGQTINDILLHVSQSVLPFGGLGQRSGGRYFIIFFENLFSQSYRTTISLKIQNFNL